MSAKATDGSGKTSKSDDGVLAALSSTRPNRLGRRSRDANGGATRAKPAAARAASAKTGAAKAAKAKAAPAKQAATSKTSPAAAKTTKTAAAKPKPAPPAKPGPTSKVSPVSAVPDSTSPRPKAIRAGAPQLKAHVEPPRDKPSSPSGTALVGTVVQAAGELAQIGATVGGQILKRAFERLPRP
jgi:hypothetical protein